MVASCAIYLLIISFGVFPIYFAIPAQPDLSIPRSPSTVTGSLEVLDAPTTWQSQGYLMVLYPL